MEGIPMSECSTQTWDSSIFKSALKVTSEFQERDIPARYKDVNASGRSDYLRWANMPRISYSASPDSLYDMEKLRKAMQDDKCFAEGVVAQQSVMGVTYPPAFYWGLAAGGLALLFTFVRGK